MFCKKCGQELPDASTFCPSCGASQQEPVQYNVANSTPAKQPKAKKPLHKKWWFWVIIGIVAIGIIGSIGGGDDSDKPSTSAPTNESANPSDSSQPDATPESNQEAENELSNIEKEYTLTAGYYTAGVDIPSGKCDVEAVSGTGNLSSSNLYRGGVNEMFGIDDGNGFYTSSFSGLKLPEGTVLSTNGKLVIKLIYTNIESGFAGRTYDEGKAVTLTSGNFTSGEDFDPGIYKIVAVSGRGNLSSSNLYDGGVNEMFGIDDGTGFYNNQFLNAVLSDGVELTVSGGLTITLIPAN